MSTQEFYDPFCILLKANSNLDVLDQASYISSRTKAWFPYDRPDHPDRHSRFETIVSFDMIVSIASIKGKRRGLVSDVSGWDNRILSSVSKTSQTWWFLFGERTSCLAIFFFSRFCGVEKLVEFHEDVRRELDVRDFSLSLISNSAHTRGEHFFTFFWTWAPSSPNLFSITGIKVEISGIAFDRPDRLSRLRAFPWSL